ncbi:hypothetical protein PSA7680_01813 [Pseudoruegeria aquimaris]|uniref:Calcineurin-like phosphoesterase domain-containing protein n=1 Tax=Pseudoruegeria aquimaris TaxID=393663 RepID=A0A1Y5SH27_9RHOB|nr:ligase-associated DNA damage response endonuclease PdeM [Pseudoruegeria aquimaris]SLN37532.1 hypothetical protein PSA7680_01813 [Pseudoruegeria aquimaris]
MNAHAFTFAGHDLQALACGALFWPEQELLCVSDLHLGKSGRIARRAGLLVPPYETLDTLARLDAALAETRARTVVCLGDSFDDLAAAGGLSEEESLWIARLQAGRRWIWIEGNHDPGPVDVGGQHRESLSLGGIVFRHIADETASGEISGHYHPKARIALRGRSLARPCFLVSAQRIILPAFGTYTGGLDCRDAAFAPLLKPPVFAVLTGTRATPFKLKQPTKTTPLR